MATVKQSTNVDIFSVQLWRTLDEARKAKAMSLNDVRTDHMRLGELLDAAVEALAGASEWYRGLLKEERADAKPDRVKTVKILATYATYAEGPGECHRCGSGIASGDETICPGCDWFICPDCMDGDAEVCKACAKDGD